MPFDAAAFDRAKFEPRRRRVEVEALAAFFPEGETPEWEVRGLTAGELQRCLDAEKRQHSVETIIRAIAKGGDQVQAVRRAIGTTNDTPGEIAKRLEMVVLGSIAPAVEMPTAVRLAEAFPMEFMLLSNAVFELTSMGADLVKPPAASQTTPA